MAIAYMNLKIISRGNATQSRNCVGSAAYDSREKLHSIDNNHTYNYERKAGDLESKGILLPANAPNEYQNRQTLWNAVEKGEKSGRAQLAREFIIALPKETTAEQRKEIVEDFCNNAFVKEGMCVDYAIHKPDKGNDNYHTHIKCTMRSINYRGEWEKKQRKVYQLDENGNRIPIIDKKTGKQKVDSKNRKQWKCTTAKTNDWDNQENLEKWRHQAEVTINKYLPEEKQISMKSYERQGIDKVGQVHEGYSKNPEKVEFNRQIRERNKYVEQIKELEKNITAEAVKERNTKMENQQKEVEQKEQEKLQIALDEKEKSNTVIAQEQQQQQEQEEMTIQEQRDYERKETVRNIKLAQEHKEQVKQLEEQLKKEKDELHRLNGQLANIEKNTHFWQNKDERKAKFIKEHHYHELQKNILQHEKELERERYLQERYQAEWIKHDRKHRELVQASKSELIKEVESELEKRQKERELAKEQEKQKTQNKTKTIDRSNNTKARSSQALEQFKGRDKSRDREWGLGR